MKSGWDELLEEDPIFQEPFSGPAVYILQNGDLSESTIWQIDSQ
jgi:hypothetical protein